MAAGDVADGIGHRYDGQSEGQGDTGESDAELRHRRGKNGAAAAAEHKPECPKGLGPQLSPERHVFPLLLSVDFGELFRERAGVSATRPWVPSGTRG
jgi:hypothetical protein